MLDGLDVQLTFVSDIHVPFANQQTLAPLCPSTASQNSYSGSSVLLLFCLPQTRGLSAVFSTSEEVKQVRNTHTNNISTVYQWCLVIIYLCGATDTEDFFIHTNNVVVQLCGDLNTVEKYCVYVYKCQCVILILFRINNCMPWSKLKLISSFSETRTRTRIQSQVRPVLAWTEDQCWFRFPSLSNQFDLLFFFCDWSVQKARSLGQPIRDCIWASASCPSPVWVHMYLKDWLQIPGTRR